MSLNMPVMTVSMSMIMAFGCLEKKEPSIVLETTVLDSGSDPVAGASIQLDGHPVGVTGEDGTVSCPLRGPEGRRVAVTVSCPTGYVSKGPSPSFAAVRFLRALAPPRSGINGDVETAFLPIRETMRCHLETQSFVLLVKTDGPQGIAVTANGRAVSATDGEGVAQLVLTGSPGEEIEVVLDTSSLPDLRPAMPSRRLNVPETARILVFEQSFKTLEPRKQKHLDGRPLGPRRIL